MPIRRCTAQRIEAGFASRSSTNACVRQPSNASPRTRAYARALAQGELSLVYQPEVTVRERRLKGVEALVRWNHPERGVIRPTAFIPIDEETGSSCRSVRGARAGVPHSSAAERRSSRSPAFGSDASPDRSLVWINLSARTTHQCRLIDRVRNALHASGASPGGRSDSK